MLFVFVFLFNELKRERERKGTVKFKLIILGPLVLCWKAVKRELLF